MSPPYTILAVDDERENLNLLANVLGDAYRVRKAKDAPAALEILSREPIDMVITDQRMPNMKGVALLERVRELKPDAVRILITAYPDISVAVDAINRGHVKRYVSKPFDPEELKVIVRQEFEFYELQRANRQLNEELGRVVSELVRANRRLRELDRMKDNFLANVSHELRTPLVSSIGYIDLILDGGTGPVPVPMEKGLRVAYRNLERLLVLIEDLLTLARLKHRQEGLELSSFDLRPLIDECVQSLRGRSRKATLDVRVKVPPNLPPVRADERRIHSVLTNVLANAEKFTPENARIDIRVTRGRDGRCSVRVEDNGVGIPPGTQKSDFPSFRPGEDSRSRRFAGLGIGLSLAQQVLQMHGCTITLRPSARRGARVSFDLPLAPPVASRT
ncbi:MAG: hybrid sensor histidine kinase/response regulator [Planctomycetes bacterium]|nr:hybrid sensor histidine kinase/response regulator [Planctomycetota bacterium]